MCTKSRYSNPWDMSPLSTTLLGSVPQKNCTWVVRAIFNIILLRLERLNFFLEVSSWTGYWPIGWLAMAHAALREKVELVAAYALSIWSLHNNVECGTNLSNLPNNARIIFFDIDTTLGSWWGQSKRGESYWPINLLSFSIAWPHIPHRFCSYELS